MKSYFLWLAKFITILFLIIVFIPALLVSISKVSNKATSNTASNNNKVAVIELTGPIISSKEIVKELHKQVKNKEVQGIVLRIDSPGGAVAPSQDIYNTVKKLKNIKPIVASMGTVAASGGLYSSLSASKVFAQPGTQTGSIGVIIQIPNVHKITEKIGVDFLTIKSGELKDVGNPTRAFTETDKKFLQKTIDTIYLQFLNDVSTGRNLDINEVKKFADGRLILGSEALEYGLVDSIGDIYDASREVYSILNKPLKDGEYPELVYKEDKFKNFKKLFDAIADLPLRALGGDVSSINKANFMLY